MSTCEFSLFELWFSYTRTYLYRVKLFFVEAPERKKNYNANVAADVYKFAESRHVNMTGVT